MDPTILAKFMALIISLIIFSYVCMLQFDVHVMIRYRPKALTWSSQLYTKRLSRPSPFQDTLLVLVFNFPHYKNIPILHEMYDDIFGKVVTCGPVGDGDIQADIKLEHTRGWYGYHCAALAIKENPGFQGYMYGNDDMIINWWMLSKRDKTKIWQGAEIVDFQQQAFGEIINKDWMWWEVEEGLQKCQQYYKDLKLLVETKQTKRNLLEIFLKNGNGQARCGKGWSDFFYIPQRYADDFFLLSSNAFSRKIFLEIAVNNILRTLDSSSNFEVLNGMYLPDIGVTTNEVPLFWQHYSLDQTFIHPFKMGIGNEEMNIGTLREKVIKHSKKMITEYRKQQRTA